MIPTLSKIGRGMRIHFEKIGELAWKERKVKSTETSNVNDAGHCLAKNSQQSGNVDRTTPLTRHTCAVQFDHSAHRPLNALGLAQDGTHVQGQA